MHWEVFPWTLYQAVHYLDQTPEVDCVTGLHLLHGESRLFVGVPGGRKILTPKEYMRKSPMPDCIGVVRRGVVDEWLAKRTDYYALEVHWWLTFGLRDSQLFVDEPWSRCYTSGKDRVSVGKDDRRLDDYLKFVEEHKGYIEHVESAVLDALLQNAWIDLTRAGRSSDARVLEDCLRLRGLPYRRVLLSRVLMKVRTKLVGARGAGATYYF